MGVFDLEANGKKAGCAVIFPEALFDFSCEILVPSRVEQQIRHI